MDRGMDEEDYEDYLVDKAKELLDEQTSDVEDNEAEKPEMRKKRNEMDEKAEKESTSKIPFSWDPQEIEHLTRNRHHLDNDDMEKFLKKDTEFHDKLQQVGEWQGFSRWEERFLVQNPEAEPEDLADELGREQLEVELKMHMMGIRAIRDE